MQTRAVPKIGSTGNPKECHCVCPLSLRQEVGFAQGFPGLKGRHCSARDELLSRSLVHSRNPSQHGLRGGIHVAAHVRHRCCNGLVEHPARVGLADKPQLIPKSQVARINLEQLGHRVLKAAGQANGCPMGNLVVGELFAGQA